MKKEIKNLESIKEAYVSVAKELKTLIAEIDKIPAEEHLELKTTLLTETNAMVKILVDIKSEIRTER